MEGVLRLTGTDRSTSVELEVVDDAVVAEEILNLSLRGILGQVSNKDGSAIRLITRKVPALLSTISIRARSNRSNVLFVKLNNPINVMITKRLEFLVNFNISQDNFGTYSQSLPSVLVELESDEDAALGKGIDTHLGFAREPDLFQWTIFLHHFTSFANLQIITIKTGDIVIACMEKCQSILFG